MEMFKNIRWGNFAGYLVLVMCLGALIFFAVYSLTTGKSLHEIQAIISSVEGIVLLLIGYFWGSSRGSKEKTELLNSQSQGENSKGENSNSK